ncbi:MAG: hypothetical protein IPK80_11885 [Nannocystis sp.]|nr:hypothetical protein [Nannocystis sp.]
MSREIGPRAHLASGPGCSVEHEGEVIHVHVGPVSLRLGRAACEALTTALARAMVTLARARRPRLVLAPPAAPEARATEVQGSARVEQGRVEQERVEQAGEAAPRELAALLAASFSALELAALLGPQERDGLWPWEQVTALAAAMQADPRRWASVAASLDQRYAAWVLRLADAPARAAFTAAREAADPAEFSGILWALLRRRRASLAPITARLGEQLVVAALSRASP